jgi:hypothetical protein
MIDSLAMDGLRLLNMNMETQCTPRVLECWRTA